MYTISILSQKGGSGKTTLALNLAGAVEAAGQVPVVADIDQQGSCKYWYDRRGRATPLVISAQAVALDEVIRRSSENGADYLIIDTAPQSESTALHACRVADLILIPCRPSFVDLKAVSVTVDLVRLSRRPALFVLSCVRPRDRTLPDGAEDFLRQYNLPVAEQRITQRAAFVHALIRGETVQEFDPTCVAAAEIASLFELVRERLGEPAGEQRGEQRVVRLVS